MQGLRYAPIAALVAVIAPEIVLTDGALLATWQDARIYAVLVGTAYFWWRRGILGTIVSGTAVLLALKHRARLVILELGLDTFGGVTRGAERATAAAGRRHSAHRRGWQCSPIASASTYSAVGKRADHREDIAVALEVVLAAIAATHDARPDGLGRPRAVVRRRAHWLLRGCWVLKESRTMNQAPSILR